MANKDSRNVLLNILLKIQKSGRFSEKIIEEELSASRELSAHASGFVRAYAMGIIRYRVMLDALIEKASSVPLNRIKPLILCILYIGAYQILVSEKSAYAAVNESVKLARQRGLSGLAGFVNGVLRRISAEKSVLLGGLSEREALSMPEQVYEKLSSVYGEEKTKEISAYFLRHDDIVYARRNASRISEEEWLRKLEPDGLFAEQTGIVRDTYKIQGIRGLSSVKSFLDGDFYVMGLSASKCIESVRDILENAELTFSALDLCASPGGKTLHALDILNGRGSVLSCDISEAKLLSIRENLTRAHFENAKTLLHDGRIFENAWEESFGLVIADVPCSGLGVIGQKPGIKYRYSEEALSGIIRLQKEISENAARYVKPGGTLLYSTCTILPEENEERVKALLDTFPEFRLVSEELLLPGNPAEGFYIARLEKKHEGHSFFYPG